MLLSMPALREVEGLNKACKGQAGWGSALRRRSGRSRKE